MTDYRELATLLDADLGRLDVVAVNLLVAKSLPPLAHLDIPRYQHLADRWADRVRDRLREAEPRFWRSPGDWKNDIHFFRLGVLCYVLDRELGVAYKEDQRGRRRSSTPTRRTCS